MALTIQRLAELAPPQVRALFARVCCVAPRARPGL